MIIPDVKTEKQKRKISKIIFREDLYPRFSSKQNLIIKYSQSIDKLPPILISQQNILIDGYHRMQAHILNNIEEINADIIKTRSEKQLKYLAYKHNSEHGMQLKSEEKKRYACEMINVISVKGLAKVLSVTEATIAVWTKSQREELAKEEERKILELYLHAENTQQDIADILNKPDFEVDGEFNEVDSIFDNAELIDDTVDNPEISRKTITKE